VVALAGRDGRTFLVVADGTEGNAAAVVEDVTDEFGGGGGGSPQFAQGGGIDADPAAVVGYLRQPPADQD
jgi:alanyl-tRNA synthetase